MSKSIFDATTDAAAAPLASALPALATALRNKSSSQDAAFRPVKCSRP
ncbi:hypothetical protein PENANT_c011G11088 [Penicillium antarcticum]|uniref:Uncharacterized protein n=1 Tax=Penicillium antarcticum TaxID=416450 RepID=A0A1V6Q6M0_9EURO|nr:hypothetical protein PENANT_c011G11088 [Penicillium antarcticum]